MESPDPTSTIDHALRLRSLWISWFLAMLFHTDLGLMPLFHGQSVEIETHVASTSLQALFAAMLAYMLVPLAALVLIAYGASSPPGQKGWRRWRAFHFGLSVLYTLTNLGHLLADLLIPDARADQIVLMGVLVAIGLLINREAWLWWRPRRPRSGPG